MTYALRDRETGRLRYEGQFETRGDLFMDAETFDMEPVIVEYVVYEAYQSNGKEQYRRELHRYDTEDAAEKQALGIYEGAPEVYATGGPRTITTAKIVTPAEGNV